MKTTIGRSPRASPVIASLLALALSACGTEPLTIDEPTTTVQPPALEPAEAAVPTTTPFDAILVKPNGELDAHLIDVIAIAAGDIVIGVRQLPLGWYRLAFAPTAPGRTEDDQAALVAAIERLTCIHAAEPDRIASAR